MPQNKWSEWAKYILEELKRLSHSQEQMEQELKLIALDINSLKAKAAMWGMFAGSIPGAIAFLIQALWKK